MGVICCHLQQILTASWALPLWSLRFFYQCRFCGYSGRKNAKTCMLGYLVIFNLAVGVDMSVCACVCSCLSLC